LSPVKLSETLAEVDYIGERLNAQPYGSHLIWTNTGNAFGYGYFYIDAIFPGVGARNPAYFVTRSDSASGEVAIMAHGVLPGGKEYYSPFSGWQWAAPVMLVSVSHGDHIEGPEGQTYQRETLLHAVDFSDPAAPVSLTPVRLPAELKSLSRIGGGPEHYLYFGGGSGVNVWGWDGVTAFKIFSQTLPTGPENSYWSASEWVGPLLVRSGADYSLSPARQQLEFWWHDAANQTFVSRLTDVFPEGTDWPQDTAVVDNVLLQSMGSGRILTYALRPDSGEIVELTDQPTAMGNGYSYILEGSAVDGAKAYVPAGVYGVEPIDLGQVGIRGEDVGPRRLLSDDDVWYPVSEDKWTVVDAKTSSRAGAIRELRWLYRADSMREVDPAAADAGDMWRESGWLGWYAHSAQAPDWIQHLEHGHLYTVVTEDPTRDGVYFFDAQLGYMWTSGQTYPWLYRYEGSEWLYYLRGTGLAGKRWFSGTHSGWIALDR
jgi:hypothetical protein